MCIYKYIYVYIEQSLKCIFVSVCVCNYLCKDIANKSTYAYFGICYRHDIEATVHLLASALKENSNLANGAQGWCTSFAVRSRLPAFLSRNWNVSGNKTWENLQVPSYATPPRDLLMECRVALDQKTTPVESIGIDNSRQTKRIKHHSKNIKKSWEICQNRSSYFCMFWHLGGPIRDFTRLRPGPSHYLLLAKLRSLPLTENDRDMWSTWFQMCHPCMPCMPW